MGGSNNAGWCVYVLKCRNNYLYVRITSNLERRLKEHESGKGSKFVRTWRPFEVARTIPCESGREAWQLEYRLKRMDRKDKLETLGLQADAVERKYPPLKGLAEATAACNDVLNMILIPGKKQRPCVLEVMPSASSKRPSVP